ncbi:sorbose reductase [Herbaspirillum sp. HC18]|nr:sorbose reductase [Herbaspirillum sp. HC18]
MDQEIHIAGIVVFARPEHITAVSACIRTLPSATIHAASPDGKLVVTLETDSTKRTLDCMDAMRALPGIVDVVLVYQHAEPQHALEQEIQP